MIPESDFLQLSGLQHFAFCRRQWALIHIEQQWSENFRTIDGAIMHERTHDPFSSETRSDIIVARGVYIRSAQLGISGQCDVLEYHLDPNGITLDGREGTWRPYPVEYKRGAPKQGDEDRLQLCGQALCLEEMLLCDIPEGALFYGETRRRERVAFTPELRQRVRDMLQEMHELYRRGYTPLVKPRKGCSACSLKDLCLPVLTKRRSVDEYLRSSLEETP